MKKATIILLVLLPILLLASCNMEKDDGNYLTFKCTKEFSITPSYDDGTACWDGILEYTTNPSDPKSWTAFAKDAVTTATSTQVGYYEHLLYIRGRNNTVISAKPGTTGDDDENADICPWTVTCAVDGFNAPLNCSGNIMTLLNCRKPEEAVMGDFCFKGLFANCKNIKTGPTLPATTLSKGCYQLMFKGCSYLNSLPTLPATELKDYCYYGMYESCTSSLYTITETEENPYLKATVMKPYCYAYMFDGCFNLSTTPRLPATTLADHCYAYMLAFTKITAKPVLPATQLEPYCYSSMLFNCYQLTSAPDLSGVTLASFSCSGLFSSCRGIKIEEVPIGSQPTNADAVLILTVPSDGYYQYAAFSGVNSASIFLDGNTYKNARQGYSYYWF